MSLKAELEADKKLYEIRRLCSQANDLYEEAREIEKELFKGFDHYLTEDGAAVIDLYNPDYEDIVRLFAINLPFEIECRDNRFRAIFKGYEKGVTI